MRHEDEILQVLKERRLPDPSDFPNWPGLRLYAERIYDAIANKELPCGINGVRNSDDPPLDDPNLTVRHVDLRTWMRQYYPDQRPAFLFSPLERSVHPLITIDAVRALIFERDFLQRQVQQSREQLEQFRAANRKEHDAISETNPTGALSPRSEMTYLHIIGGLLHLLLGRSPSGQPYSTFGTQESIISAMVAHHGERLGIATRTLEAKFAAANRAVGKH
jgi:hypothetical protein